MVLSGQWYSHEYQQLLSAQTIQLQITPAVYMCCSDPNPDGNLSLTLIYVTRVAIQISTFYRLQTYNVHTLVLNCSPCE